MRGGLVDILQDEYNALVYDPGDIRSLLAQLRRVQHEPELRAGSALARWHTRVVVAGKRQWIN